MTTAHGPRPARGALLLTRGIAATWWYTLSAVAFFEGMLVLVWTGAAFTAGSAPAAAAVVGGIGAMWWASTLLLLRDYRRRGESTGIEWRRVALPLLVAVATGIAGVALTGSWLLAAAPVLQSLILLDWQPGLRLRLVVAVTLVLGALWFADSRAGIRAEVLTQQWWVLGFYSVALPAMTVLSLWWWDVLVALDRARASEARLAATQERLRIATDVHDLQGHHLQVIALQLELAERLMPQDPDAGLEQLRAARVSVDEARQGTRDLATRFRSVPLTDEIANARDLLRAAGLAVDAVVDQGVEAAPASVLGPVIRETTTNVLRHGGGRRASLALQRDAGAWRYEIVNDVASDPAPPVPGGGAGLEGIGRRVAEAGGSLDVRGGDEFVVTVTVPATIAPAGDEADASEGERR